MERAFSFVEQIFGRYAIVVRYLMSGGSSFGVSVVTLYLLTEYLGVYYLVSAVFAFLAGFFVSFFMMKHWTFRDGSTDKVRKQLAGYLCVSVSNLFLNTSLVYIFVEYAGIWYIFSQIIASLLIAVSSFFIYKFIIFNDEASHIDAKSGC